MVCLGTWLQHEKFQFCWHTTIHSIKRGWSHRCWFSNKPIIYLFHQRDQTLSSLERMCHSYNHQIKLGPSPKPMDTPSMGCPNGHADLQGCYIPWISLTQFLLEQDGKTRHSMFLCYGICICLFAWIRICNIKRRWCRPRYSLATFQSFNCFYRETKC